MKKYITHLVVWSLAQVSAMAATTAFQLADDGILQSTAGTYQHVYYDGSFYANGDYEATVGTWVGYLSAYAPDKPTQYTASVTSLLTITLEVWDENETALLSSVSASGYASTETEVGGGIWGQVHMTGGMAGDLTGNGLSSSGFYNGNVNVKVTATVAWTNVAHLTLLYGQARSDQYPDPWMGNFTTTTVPEPSAWVFAFLGCTCLMRRRRSSMN